MKKIKLKLSAEQMGIFKQMLDLLSLFPSDETKLLLERFVLLEFYRRNVRQFTFISDSPITLTPSEALALNRVMQKISWDIQGAGQVATHIIWQIDPYYPVIEVRRILEISDKIITLKTNLL